MKRINGFSFCFLFIWGVLILLANGCSSDDPAPNLANELVGTWTIARQNVEFSAGGYELRYYLGYGMGWDWDDALAKEKEVTERLGTQLKAELGKTMVLTSDKTYATDFWGGLQTGTWIITGPSSKTFTLIRYPEDNLDYELISLKANEWVFRRTVYFHESLKDGETWGDEFKGSVKFVMTR
jgi:hypothetical protein